MRKGAQILTGVAGLGLLGVAGAMTASLIPSCGSKEPTEDSAATDEMKKAREACAQALDQHPILPDQLQSASSLPRQGGVEACARHSMRTAKQVKGQMEQAKKLKI
ncbi:MAG: hypothetical protein WC924_03020 [Candidatus Gracilibacteria bacterium]